jgi:uncharacterized RDD family membrane protein YckC
MNSVAAAPLTRTKPTPRPEKITNFSPAELQAPFLLRIGALLIDYILLMIFPVLGLLSDMVFDGGLDVVTDRTLWLLSVIVFILNIIVLPVYSTRTFGKFVTGIRVVRIDGTLPGRITMLYRQTIGYLLTIVTAGLGFLISLFNPGGRALHDFLAGTVVVYGSRRLS